VDGPTLERFLANSIIVKLASPLNCTCPDLLTPSNYDLASWPFNLVMKLAVSHTTEGQSDQFRTYRPRGSIHERANKFFQSSFGTMAIQLCFCIIVKWYVCCALYISELAG
jgi:hypothetical protein